MGGIPKAGTGYLEGGGWGLQEKLIHNSQDYDHQSYFFSSSMAKALLLSSEG